MTYPAAPSRSRPLLETLTQVNNAGTNVRKSILDATAEEFATITRVNQESTWHLCKLAHALLVRSPRPTVVNVASAAGVQSTGSGSVYAMTKAAVEQLTKSLACEWAKYGIRVNCVAPWVTLTPLLAEAIRDDPSSLEKASSWTPMGRPGNPEEVRARPPSSTLLFSDLQVTSRSAPASSP